MNELSLDSQRLSLWRAVVFSTVLGVLGLLGLILRKLTPILAGRLYRIMGEEQFQREWKQLNSSSNAIHRMEPVLESCVESQRAMSIEVHEIRELLTGFAQQLGQVQGGVQLPQGASPIRPLSESPL